LVTIEQMVRALTRTVGNPCQGVVILDVSGIRKLSNDPAQA
jgi:hypothetical protein